MKNIFSKVALLLLVVSPSIVLAKKKVKHEVVVEDTCAHESLGDKASRVAGNVVEKTKEAAVVVKDKTVELAHRGQEASTRGVTEAKHAAAQAKDKTVELAHKASEAKAKA